MSTSAAKCEWALGAAEAARLSQISSEQQKRKVRRACTNGPFFFAAKANGHEDEADEGRGNPSGRWRDCGSEAEQSRELIYQSEEGLNHK